MTEFIVATWSMVEMEFYVPDTYDVVVPTMEEAEKHFALMKKKFPTWRRSITNAETKEMIKFEFDPAPGQVEREDEYTQFLCAKLVRK